MLPRFPAGKGTREIGSKRKGKRGKEEFLKGKCNQGHQLPTDDTSNSQQSWLNIGNIPSPAGVREDGTFEGLDGDANSRAMAPYDVQPDPIVSQQAIVASAPRELAVGNSVNTLAVRRTSYGLRTSASNYARRMIEEDPTREVFIQEDGVMVPCMDLVSTRQTTIKLQLSAKAPLKTLEVPFTKTTLKTLDWKGEQALTSIGEHVM